MRYALGLRFGRGWLRPKRGHADGRRGQSVAMPLFAELPAFARQGICLPHAAQCHAAKSGMVKIPIKLQDRSSNASIPAVISDRLDEEARNEIIRFGERSRMRRLLDASSNLLRGDEGFQFNWKLNLYKADYDEDAQVWIVECAHAAARGLPKTQGAMIIKAGASQANQQGVLIIAGIESAQHNQRMALGPLRWGGAYRGVGAELIRHAMNQSMNLGFQGRIGGHSTPGAERFYLSLGFTRHAGLTDAHGNVYFELN